MEQTVVLIKPDAVEKKVIGKIITYLEDAHFRLVAGKFTRLTDEIIDRWYAHHKDKPFFPELKKFMMETPVMAMVWEGEGVISKVREICGPTNSLEAPKGTIRADLGTDIQHNAVHASEDGENARREIGLLFSPEEILSY